MTNDPSCYLATGLAGATLLLMGTTRQWSKQERLNEANCLLPTWQTMVAVVAAPKHKTETSCPDLKGLCYFLVYGLALIIGFLTSFFASPSW